MLKLQDNNAAELKLASTHCEIMKAEEQHGANCWIRFQQRCDVREYLFLRSRNTNSCFYKRPSCFFQDIHEDTDGAESGLDWFLPGKQMKNATKGKGDSGSAHEYVNATRERFFGATQS